MSGPLGQLVVWTLGSLLGLLPVAVFAAPLAQERRVEVQVAPQVAQPGQAVQIAVRAQFTPEQPNVILCIGLLGPGRNLELGLAPAFRVRLGQVQLGPDLSGQATVGLPSNVAEGTYQVVVGGCPPQPDLAPLAALGSAELRVGAVPSVQAPQQLPRTGELPTPDPALVGVLALAAGSALLGRRSR